MSLNWYNHSKLRELYPDGYKTLTQALYKHVNGVYKRRKGEGAPSEHWSDKDIVKVAVDKINIHSAKYKTNIVLWRMLYEKHRELMNEKKESQ